MLKPRTSVSRMAIASCILVLTLSACQKSGSNADNGQPATAPPIAALALATAPPPGPITYAPPVSALPAPAPVPLRLRQGRDRYGYTDRAYAMSRAFGDTPPDYTVDYDGTRPWVWRSDDGSYRVVEQLPDGQRTYYYERGADRPFYITDPDGGYAYDGGQLVGLYGPDGAPLPDNYARQRAENAARYYDRSAAVFRAVQYNRRQAAYADEWRARRAALAEQQQRWDQERTRDSDWSAWHDEHQQDEDRDWQAEQNRRAAYAVAIGAAAVGVAALLSHDHGDGGQNYGGQNYAGPPPANRPGNGAPMPAGGGYAQRPNQPGAPAGSRDAGHYQQQPPAPQQPAGRYAGQPAGQYAGQHAGMPQSPRGPGANYPQYRQPQQAPVAMPARQAQPLRGAESPRPFAPVAGHGVRYVQQPPSPTPRAVTAPRAIEPVAITRPPEPARFAVPPHPVAPRPEPAHFAAPPQPAAPRPESLRPEAPRPMLLRPAAPMPMPAALHHAPPPPRAPDIPGEHPHHKQEADGKPHD